VTDILPDISGTLIERLGITITEMTAARTTGTMPVTGNTQTAGLLHGGASAALAETLGSLAAKSHAGPGRYAVGIELNVTHHRSVTSGIVTGEATALSLGRTLASYDIVIRDEDGNRISTSRLACLIRDVR
jgi:uncharacterized protein (TIGR00369 family)